MSHLPGQSGPRPNLAPQSAKPGAPSRHRRRAAACTAQTPGREGAQQEEEQQKEGNQGCCDKWCVFKQSTSNQLLFRGLEVANIWGLFQTDDFEVSIFLTETSTRHSLLTKRKYFREKVPGKLQSNSSKLIDETNNEPFDVDDNVPILREDSDDYVNLEAIPTLDGTPTTKRSRRNKRQRGDAVAESDSELESDGNGYVPAIEINSDDEEIVRPPPSKRSRRGVATLGDDEDDDAEDPDDKKKMALEISYEGFAIYGLCLCLIVKRREPTLRPSGNARAASTGTTATRSGNDVRPSGHAVMENWIASTQVPAGADAAEDAGG